MGQDRLLVGKEFRAVEGAADVPVGGVQDSHAAQARAPHRQLRAHPRLQSLERGTVGASGSLKDAAAEIECADAAKGTFRTSALRTPAL
ncbi:hypothetical protein GCM10009754_38980 [Amycolatopsis minnesotensis]|uniref:Uncharacterized protein n=1 Tax=Amycolatopsis minnesotensis TaxID=337894 RepID=A0ABP5CIQ2_9PSEU